MKVAKKDKKVQQLLGVEMILLKVIMDTDEVMHLLRVLYLALCYLLPWI